MAGILGEVLNDYAVALLSARGRRRRPTKERVDKARALLLEASQLARRGGYGWTQVELNLPRASSAAGDLATAQRRLEELRDYCTTEMPGGRAVATAMESAREAWLAGLPDRHRRSLMRCGLARQTPADGQASRCR